MFKGVPGEDVGSPGTRVNLTWVLRTELSSSARAVGTLNWWAAFPSHLFVFEPGSHYLAQVGLKLIIL